MKRKFASEHALNQLQIIFVSMIDFFEHQVHQSLPFVSSAEGLEPVHNVLGVDRQLKSPEEVREQVVDNVASVPPIL